MSRLRLATVLGVLTILLPLMYTGAVTQVANAAGTQFIRQISRAGTASFKSTSQGSGVSQTPELPGVPSGGNHAAAAKSNSVIFDRSHSLGAAASRALINSANMANSSLELERSFDGLNHYQQRTANGGNQFSLEPPDQGLCVGNGFVMESINDAIRVYDTSGNPLTGVTALNSFYGYPPSINRTTGVFGQFVFDPSCYFDKPTQRWFQVADTLEVDPTTGAETGKNHIDIAVSQTADPTGAWNIYRLPVQDDGTDGTPNHHCEAGPCFGDYPHVGADANGFYLTTNEYGLFATGLGFHAAQVYAFSKSQLASGAANIAVTQIDTIGSVGLAGNPGFTLWPAVSPDRQYASGLGGTEYFLSSDAAPEANGNGVSIDLIVWALTNTQSLNTGSPSLTLSNTILTVNPYGVPPKADQKVGNTPLRQCLNDATCATVLLGSPDPFTEVQGPLDSNDTRMQQVTYADGKLWGALDTILTVGGVNKAGIEWFIVSPSVSTSGVAGKLVKQGYLGMANANVTYPAIGVTTSGKGVMAFTLVGKNNYPSAAYASIDATHGVGDIHVAAAGVGPQDGFSEYKVYSPFGNGVPRPRWGDYGAAVPVGNSVWIASEYIGQTCTFAQYEASPFGTCGGTRTALANWYTRISLVEIS